MSKGFLTQYLGEQLSARVKRVVAEQLKSKAVGYEVLICGHSLGGAVATLCAYELASPVSKDVHPSRHLWIAAYGQHRVCQRVVTASQPALLSCRQRV